VTTQCGRVCNRFPAVGTGSAALDRSGVVALNPTDKPMGTDGIAAITAVTVNTTQRTPCQYIKEVMQAPGDPAQTRARRACEPCRRKKTKCPGERPMCSFCRRLRQPCTYSRRREATSDIVRVHNQQLLVGAPEHSLADLLLRSHTEILQEGDSSRERLQQLESHVEQIYGLLR
jgi:hypothetical protein